MSIVESILSKFRKKGEPASDVAVDKEFLKGRIRKTSLFADMPDAVLDTVLAHMEAIAAPDGKVVIREGDEGDYYYLLAKGTAKATRQDAAGKPAPVADLADPVAFGEEALISNRKRNATVTMTSEGALLRLSKDAFGEYVKKPLVKWLFSSEADAVIAQGGRWIDVRSKGERSQDGMPDALTIPLDEIRDRTGELDRGTAYVCYCQNGRLSSTAAFLLRQRGYDAGVLRGGLQARQRR